MPEFQVGDWIEWNDFNDESSAKFRSILGSGPFKIVGYSKPYRNLLIVTPDGEQSGGYYPHRFKHHWLNTVKQAIASGENNA